ncbi:MAG: hypothetical protein GF350_15245 [Chitinivibrionales bacterium]|nr:hypothetical protein [Chitinivibrionales bacterium]
MAQRITGWSAIALFIFMANLSYGITIYVSPNGNDNGGNGSSSSPYATLTKARDVLRASTDTDKMVLIRGGDYFLDTPLQLTEQDGGSSGHPVVWKNADGEEPRIFGGQRITGWELWQGNIYRAPLGLAPSEFWSLSENGTRSVPARQPNWMNGRTHGLYARETSVPTITYNSGEFPSEWDYEHSRLSIDACGWFSYSCPVNAVDFAQRKITYEPSHSVDNDFWGYWVEGAKEFIDQPSEWAIGSDGYLYYWPKKTPIQDQVIVVPKMMRIIEIKGNESSPVGHLRIEGLTLSTTDCVKYGVNNKLMPVFSGNSVTKYDEHCSNCEDLEYTAHGLVHLENTEFVAVKHCKLLNAGMNAVYIRYHAQHDTIYGNWMEGINRHGVCFSSYCACDGPWDQISMNNVVRNNYIYRFGCHWSNGCGIYIYQTASNDISNNEIRGGPRYGITFKGVSGCYKDQACLDLRVKNANNRVAYNDISHVIHSTKDVGMIEAWSSQSGNIIEHNLLHDTYHLPYDARTGNAVSDPDFSTGFIGLSGLDEDGGGTDAHKSIYIDGWQGDFTVTKNLEFNFIDGLYLGHNDDGGYNGPVFTRSIAKQKATAIGFDFGAVGLLNDFRWHTPAMDESEIEWPEEVLLDPELAHDYLSNFGAGTGLTGDYRSGTERRLYRNDPYIAFHWLQSPTGSSSWSATWTGEIEAPFDGEYRFMVRTENSPAIAFDGEAILEPSTSRKVDEKYYANIVQLQAKLKYPIEVSLTGGGGTGYFALDWQSQHDTGPTIPVSLVPVTQLYPSDPSAPYAFEVAARKPAKSAAAQIPAIRYDDNAAAIFVQYHKPLALILTDVAGKVHARCKKRFEHSVAIDTRSLPAGVYMLSATGESINLCHRYIIR